jgi:hypothetical protein
MRLLGSALLLGGYLLCISGYLLCDSLLLVAIGFFMLGLGLICWLIAEARTAVPRLAGPNAWKEPLQFPEPAAAFVSPNKLRPNQSSDLSDGENWQSVVENDPDISRLLAVLAPYGQQYVDELARAYLVLDNKEYLPMIIDKIVKSATRGADKDVTNSRALQRLHAILAESAELTNSTPRIDPIGGSRLPKRRTRDLLDAGTSAADGSAPTLDMADANMIANVTALKPEEEVASATYPETGDDLADLLSKLDLRMGPRANDKI